MFKFDFTAAKVDSLNVLVLAFIGDAAHTLFIRTRLCGASDGKAGALHSRAKKYVSAKGQAAALDTVAPMLTEEEADICRRARNHHNKTAAKNADLATYKKATAFEALLGYHYLLGNENRFNELIEKSLAQTSWTK